MATYTAACEDAASDGSDDAAVGAEAGGQDGSTDGGRADASLPTASHDGSVDEDAATIDDMDATRKDAAHDVDAHLRDAAVGSDSSADNAPGSDAAVDSSMGDDASTPDAARSGDAGASDAARVSDAALAGDAQGGDASAIPLATSLCSTGGILNTADIEGVVARGTSAPLLLRSEGAVGLCKEPYEPQGAFPLTRILSAVYAPDGSLYGAGEKRLSGAGQTLVSIGVTKRDSGGQESWTRLLNSKPAADVATPVSLAIGTDGDLLVASQAVGELEDEFGEADGMPYIAQLGPDNTVRWFRQFSRRSDDQGWTERAGDAANSYPISIHRGPNGRAIAAFGFALVAVDSSGTELWRTLTSFTASAGATPQPPSEIFVSEAGVTYLAGWADSTNRDAYLISVDASGVQLTSQRVEAPPLSNLALPYGTLRLAVSGAGLVMAAGFVGTANPFDPASALRDDPNFIALRVTLAGGSRVTRLYRTGGRIGGSIVRDVAFNDDGLVIVGAEIRTLQGRANVEGWALPAYDVPSP